MQQVSNILQINVKIILEVIVNSSTAIGYNMSCELQLHVPEYPWLGGT